MPDRTTGETTDGATSHLTKLQKPQQVIGYNHPADEAISQSIKSPNNGDQVPGYKQPAEELLAGHPKDGGQVIGHSLSVIIITKDEADNIRACLESVSWVDEIIVVDSGSQDDTVAISRKITPHVYVHNDWPGFGVQKNRALGYASKDWVLSLDADERVTPELRCEIEAVLNATNAAAAYRIPRLSNYCGRFIRHSGWYPDYVPRLFRRGSARFSDDLVHERLLVDGSTAQLEGMLLHYAFGNLEEVLHKVDQYSSAGAKMLHQRGRKATLTGAVLRGLWSFMRTYFLRAGFLDGREGFMLAVSNAEGTYYRYLKLMLLNQKK